MLQLLIIALLFVVAIAYIGVVVSRNLRSQSNCASGCGKCDEAISSAKPS